MNTGSQRSVHFGVAQLIPPRATSRKVALAAEAAADVRDPNSPSVDPTAPREPSILTVGSIGRDYVLIGQQIETLHHEPASYHGKLQVILSALKRMEEGVKRLIEEVG